MGNSANTALARASFEDYRWTRKDCGIENSLIVNIVYVHCLYDAMYMVLKLPSDEDEETNGDNSSAGDGDKQEGMDTVPSD